MTTLGSSILFDMQTLLEEPKHWIKGAIKHPGALHKQLGVKTGDKIPKKTLRAAAKKDGKLGRRARLALTLSKMSEDTAEDVKRRVRDKLREIVSAARHRYKTSTPEDLADDLEVMLRHANLAKPPKLSKAQYDAVAEVWSALGDDLGEVEAMAGRALMRMSESKDL
jgi:hypothetical protein